MSTQIQTLESNVSNNYIHNYIEGLLEVEQKEICLEKKHIQKNQLQKNLSKEKNLNDIILINIGTMQFAVFSEDIDFIKPFDNRLKVYADQAESILGKAHIGDDQAIVIKAKYLHPNIIENTNNKQKKLLVFNQKRHALLCDDVTYLNNIRKKELVLFDNDLITSWFVGVHKEKIARIISLRRLVDLLALQ